MSDKITITHESSPSNGTVIRDERDLRIERLERELADKTACHTERVNELQDAGAKVERLERELAGERVERFAEQSVAGHTIDRLERELAEARVAEKNWHTASDVQEVLVDELRAALAALREQRCEECAWALRHDPSGEWLCNLCQKPCYVMGHRCGAWARRET